MQQYMEAVRVLPGVHCVLLFNDSSVVAREILTLYDESALGKVIGALRHVVGTLSSQGREWERLVANFASGKMYLKNLDGKNMLAVIGGMELNATFTNVAVNIAAEKIKIGLNTPKQASSLDDPNSSEAIFVKQCTLALAQHLGPIAKMLTKKAIRTVAPSGHLENSQFPQLVTLLEKEIEMPNGKIEFRKAMAKQLGL